MGTNTLSEEDSFYLSRLMDGDKEAFNALFHKYYRSLCLYAYQFVTFEDVEEIVGDVLLWLWEHHDTLLIHTSLSSFLYKSVRLKCLTRIEQNQAQKRRETLYWEKVSEDVCTELSDCPEEELLKRIHDAIDRLPEKYREAFVLHRFHDCTYKEIAERLNVSPKTVDYRIRQALILLREDLKDYFPALLLYCGRYVFIS